MKKDFPHWLYFLLDNGKIVYIGVTKNLKQRMRYHNREKQFNAVRVIKFKIQRFAMDYERRWIMKFKPKYNKPVNDYWSQEYQDSMLRPLAVLVNKHHRDAFDAEAESLKITVSELLRIKLGIDVKVKRRKKQSV